MPSTVSTDDAAEAAWLDFLQERRALLSAGWDESQHPRHPEGDPRGGQFRAKEGFSSDEQTPPHDQLGSERDPNWTGPAVRPQGVSWGGHIFDPLQHSDAIWNGYRIPYMQANMDTDELREAWRLNDMNPTEYQQAISEQFAADVADAPVMIRTPATRVEDILADGRFKSQHETIGSEGAYSPEVRRVQENMFFGYDDSLPPEHRPIYGYVDNGNAGVAAAEQYGDVRWELRPETWPRTTVSDADSLSRPLVPGPKANPGWRAALPAGYSDMGMGGGFGTGQQRDQLTWGFGNEDYIEAQVHGGVSLGDVKAVWLPEDWEDEAEAWVPDRYGYSRRINVPELVEKLRSHGIEVGYGE